MDITEVLKFVDEMIFATTGKHVDYLQEAILRGTLEGRTYSKIAEETYSSEGHVRDAGSELWKILSKALGEEITKPNFRAIVDSGKIYSFSTDLSKNDVKTNTAKICTQSRLTQIGIQQPPETPTHLHLDLEDAPEIFSFYGRTEELSTLENWIVNDGCRLVALLGMSGIGKTTLAIRLVEQIKIHFDYVIYRSLRFSPTLEATLTNLLQIFSPESEIPQSIETQLSQLLKHLRTYRCLIVFDDGQMLFSSGKLAGQYKPDCESYQLFFKLIAEVSHKSCLIVNSWEKPRECSKLERSDKPIRSFVLESLGSAAKEILQEKKLSNEETWETLIDTYQGNPLWLELIATLIQELFGGRVAEFLQLDTLILCESLQAQLYQKFQRLTQQEHTVIAQLARETEPVALPQISNATHLSLLELLNALQSLERRLLLDKKEENSTVFTLKPVLKQYVKIRYL